jgi:outer membrane receptor for ferrienterochelin and colicin
MSTKQHFILLAFIGIFLSSSIIAQDKEEKIVIKTKTEANQTKKLDLSLAGEHPLIVVDGVEKNKKYLSENVTADQIESVNVIKGAKALEKFGAKGKHGVIEVITKKGSSDSSGASNQSTLKIKASNDEIKDYKVLFLVDGKVVEQSATEQINPDDIAKIDVIKDPKQIAKFAEGGDYDGMVKIEMKKN